MIWVFLSSALWPLAIGYLLGSIPFGLLIAKYGGAGDVRKIGSGNIGATNVLRTGNKGLAAATLLADALKGTAAVWLVGLDPMEGALAAALGAFLGHLYPVWLKFKGGKGIATYVGLLGALSWQALLAFAVVWLAIAAALRYSSLAALAATVAAPMAAYVSGSTEIATMLMILTALAWWKHRENISRLLSGTESKIGTKG